MCAKQVINIGTTANDGTGDPLRSAFDKVNDNFTELYTDDAGDVNSITATAPIVRDSATGAVTISLANAGVTFAKVQNVAANSLLVRDANSSGVLTEKALATTQILIGDGTGMTAAALSGDATMTNAGVVSIGTNKVITDKILNSNVTTAKIADDAVTADKLANSINSEITANTAKVTNATHTGDVTGATALTIASNAVTTAKILNDNVTHDKLENRYTAAVTISTLTGAYTLDWSTGAVFVMSGSLSGAIEFDFTNFKAGQTIDIYNLTGAQTITFDSNAGTSETFNKCGAVDYAGASTNLIQVQCVDDSATAVFNYAVSAYVSDATPS